MHSSRHKDSAAGAAPVGSGQYLSFTLGDEDYGIDILKVREIRGWEEVRPLPDTPDFVKGVLDLRGSIVPVLDLRLRFNIGDAIYSPTTVTIIANLQQRSKQHTLGMVVDSVSDVLDIEAHEIKQSPDLGKGIDTRYISGMVSRDQHVVLLLDVDALMDLDELVGLDGM